ncbi:MAG: hypothetical protein QXP36_07910 [Conexivisphaerales archaeon]
MAAETGDVIPLIMPYITDLIQKAEDIANTPVIGIHHSHSSTSRRGRENSKTDYDFQLRAWEIGVLFMGFVIYEAVMSVESFIQGLNPFAWATDLSTYVDMAIEADMNGTPKPSPSNLTLVQYLEAKIMLALEKSDMTIEDIIHYLFPNGLFPLEEQNIPPSGGSTTTTSTTTTAPDQIYVDISTQLAKMKNDLLQNILREIRQNQQIEKDIVKGAENIGKDIESGLSTVEKDIKNVGQDIAKDVESGAETVEKKVGGFWSWLRSHL